MGGLTRRVLAVVAAGGLLLGLVPVTSAATWVEFGTPTVESSFEAGVRFSQPVTLAEPAGRVELLLTVADAIGPTIIVVPDPSLTGSTTLSHTVGSAGDGHFMPNTPLAARWRLVAADDPTDVQVGPEIRVTYADDRFAWRTEAGDVVRVHWVKGSDAFGRRALRIAEDAIEETSTLLGVTESKPIDFYIYADENAFREAIGPGVRENVGGLAVAGIRTLFALIPPARIDDAWVGVVVPHELTHLVFDTASENAYHSPPHWLNEGVADYVSQGYTPSYRAKVRDASRSGTLIPLDGLTGQFPTTRDRFLLAYAESVSAVDYLVRTYGTDALVGLIRSYADGRTDDKAFAAALGVDMATFAAAWLDDLDAKAPTRYGPEPAPSGPVPAVWAGPMGGGVSSSPPPTASGAPSATEPASPLPGQAAGTGLADPPAWMAPLVAIVCVVVVVMLLLAARRNRATAASS